MRLVLLLTSGYGDPHAEDWQPELRHTATFLRRQGTTVDVVYRPTLDGLEAVVPSAEPHVLYVELTEENAAPALAAVARAHLPRSIVVVGGPAPAAAPQAILAAHPPVDYVIVGERERPLLDLLRRLAEGRSPGDIAGLTARTFANPPAAPIADLDELGNMADDGLADLLAHWPASSRVGYLSSSRGCYARCAFCGVPGFSRIGGGPAWRGRSPAFVVDEMGRLADKLGIGRFVFSDDNFIGPGRNGHERAVEIARMIRARGLDVRFSLCCRITDVRRDTLEPLIDAGLDRLGMSIESLNADSPKLLQEECTVPRIEAALDLVEQLPLTCEVNLIFFDPYVTLAGVRDSLALLERIRRSEHLVYSDAFPFNELLAFPWAPVSRRLRRDGLLEGADVLPCYRDPAVGELVRFVRRLRERLPLAFKRRYLFDSLASAGTPASAIDSAARADLLRISDGLRAWVGLVVTPRYVGAACNELERAVSPAAVHDALHRLENEFAEEIAVLTPVARAMGEVLAGSPA
jgi:hypothetical protein